MAKDYMKKIVFMWCKARHEGLITAEEPSSLGKRTVISVTKIDEEEFSVGMVFTMYGKCEVGDCGPYTVLSII